MPWIDLIFVRSALLPASALGKKILIIRKNVGVWANYHLKITMVISLNYAHESPV